MSKCLKCDGTGTIWVFKQLYLPPREGEHLPRVLTTDKYKDTCPSCRGSGVVK